MVKQNEKAAEGCYNPDIDINVDIFIGLTAECNYELMGPALGGKGVLCRTQTEITRALHQAFGEKEKPTVINVLIKTNASRKQQEFTWLTRSKM